MEFFAGLPDGLFSNQKSQFWLNLEGLRMGNVVILYHQLEYFTAIWYNLWPFGVACGRLVYFFRFGMFEPRKICQLLSFLFPWLPLDTGTWILHLSSVRWLFFHLFVL
jgi:hypothetical protein